MFIVSKRNYQVRRADGSSFLIRKDFIGEIPEDVAKSSLVQRAIRGGMIAIPEGMKDKQLEQADAKAEERAADKDIRPDAAKETCEETPAGEEKTNAEEKADAERNEGKESGKRSQKK